MSQIGTATVYQIAALALVSCTARYGSDMQPGATESPGTAWEARLEPPAQAAPLGEPVRVTFVVRNRSSAPAELSNPDVGIPPAELDWPYGLDTYRAATLASFGLLALELTDPEGRPISNTGPNPWVTPIMGPRLVLAPGASMTLPIIVSDFFELDAIGQYRLRVTYGDGSPSVTAEAPLTVGQPRPPQPAAPPT